jgi:hypothetical protein
MEVLVHLKDLRDALVYVWVGTLSGLGRERMGWLGQSPSPEKERYGTYLAGLF